MNALDGKESRASASLVDRVPAPWFFVGSAIFHYLGPSFAVLLFARVPVAGVAWLRIASAALVFALWRQPWRSFFRASPGTRWTIVALGAVLAAMNYVFYRAIAELPLATVAAIEFVGPIVLASAGVRTRRNLAALALVIVGIHYLTGSVAGVPRAALGWAFANAALFALYIVLAHKLARADLTTSSVDRLGASMLIAAIVISPLGFSAAMSVLFDPVALGAGLAVGISSSVIPYALDQIAMSRLPRATYALFVALLPATAVLVGMVVLRQWPSHAEQLGVGLVVAAIALHRPAGQE